MSRATDMLIEDAEEALRRRVLGSGCHDPLDRACAAWLLPSVSDDKLGLTNLAREAAEKVGAARNYGDVSVLGYASVCGASAELTEPLRAGLEWVSGRKATVTGQRMEFVADGVALLGIALGARHIEDAKEDGLRQKVTEWLAEVSLESVGLPRLEAWQRCLLSAAGCCLGCPGATVPVDDELADIRVALRAQGVLPAVEGEERETEERAALESIKRGSCKGLPPVRCALRLRALAWITEFASVNVNKAASNDDVVRLLSHVGAALQLWTWEKRARTGGRTGEARKWHIDHEYHVQNLLWAILRPVFPDLDNEAYTPSVGPVKPRADLHIPSMKLIVEVKFMRRKDSPQDMVKQIAEDASLYLSQPGVYDGIVVFLWDESRRSEQHPVILKGLKSIRGVIDAVIVSRPGSWDGDSAGPWTSLEAGRHADSGNADTLMKE